MAKKLRWSIKARSSRRNIFEYWNYRNKSKLYSNKLNKLYNEGLKIVVGLPKFGHPKVEESIKFIIVSHFEVFYKITPN
jgi:toxin YoeB